MEWCEDVPHENDKKHINAEQLLEALDKIGQGIQEWIK